MEKHEIYNKVKEEVKLEDVIRSYGIELRPSSGKNYVAICPFHNDKNASLSVKTDSQFYKCFSCGAKGTAIEFIIGMEQKTNPNFGFNEALVVLKEKFGLDIDADKIAQEIEENKYKGYDSDQKQKLILYDKINKIFEFYLTNSTQGKKYLDYLLDRGLTLDTIKQFGIGYCPDNAISQIYSKLSPDEQKHMEELGLINTNKSNKTYDYFNERVTIPLKDVKGNIIGYTARTLDPRENAKYKNSQESSVFLKSRQLFNLNNAINFSKIDNKLYVVEGNFDTIACDQMKLKNVVGLNSCELTDDQLQTIKSANVEVILALDNDNAGINGILKIGKKLEENGIDCTCIDISHYGNYKDFGDVLKENKNQLDNIDFEKNLNYIEETFFKYRLEHELFKDIPCNSLYIKRVFNRIKDDITLDQKNDFIQYCSEKSSLDHNVVASIIEPKEKSEQQPFAKLGEQLLSFYLTKYNLTDFEKELVAIEAMNNFDTAFHFKESSVEINQDFLKDSIDKVKKMEKSVEIKDALKQEIAKEENKTIKEFTTQTFKNIYRIYCDDTNYQFREKIVKGSVNPQKIESYLGMICDRLNAIKESNHEVSRENKIDIVSSSMNNLSIIRPFNKYGKFEKIALENMCDYVGLDINKEKLDVKEILKLSLEVTQKNDKVGFKNYLNELVVNNEINEEIGKEIE